MEALRELSWLWSPRTIFTVATTLVSVLGVTFLWLKLIQFLQRRKQLPPGPKPWPVLGNLPALTGLPYRSLQKLATKYGGLMYLRLGGHLWFFFLLLRDHAHVHLYRWPLMPAPNKSHVNKEPCWLQINVLFRGVYTKFLSVSQVLYILHFTICLLKWSISQHGCFSCPPHFPSSQLSIDGQLTTHDCTMRLAGYSDVQVFCDLLRFLLFWYFFSEPLQIYMSTTKAM